MTFRRTRRTNDLLGRLTFGACLLGVVVAGGILVGVWVVEVEAVMGHLCFGCLAVAFAVVTGFAGWQLLKPSEWEFVVEDGVIRWGPTARPDRQRRILVADIRRVFVDEREQEVVAETATGRAVCGDFVLIGKADRQALIEFLKLHHPGIVRVNGL